MEKTYLKSMKIKILIIVFVLFNLACYSQVSTVTNAITGRTWMDRNLGASQVATSLTDSASYGSLYQWGRLTDGHELSNSSTTTIVSTLNNPGHSNFIIGSDDWITPSNDLLWQGVNGINNPCPNGFRLPTEAEWEAERLSWTSNDAAGAFASVLKLPIAGARSRMTGAIGNVGTFAGYRSSDLNGVESRNLGISLGVAMMGNRARADGNCVRCIQDNSLGINIASEYNKLKIYPNPSSGFFTVNSEKQLSNIEFELIDLFGRKLMTGTLNGLNSVIDIKVLPDGIYLLKLENFTLQKIIKGK
jgi:uncharacterized protein (TIGR02145 family)